MPACGGVGSLVDVIARRSLRESDSWPHFQRLPRGYGLLRFARSEGLAWRAKTDYAEHYVYAIAL
jgi:hypothetical protein